MKKENFLGILFLFFASLILVAEDADKIQIGFQSIIVKTSFPQFNRKLITNSWGENILEKAIIDRTPYIEVAHSFDRRYFIMSKVGHIDYWNCQLVVANQSAFLAKVQLLFLIWDREKQREVMRKTVSGYAVRDAQEASHELSLELLQQAFEQASLEMAGEIVRKFPLTGRILQTQWGGAKITVNLGRSHGVNALDKLKVIYDEKQLGTFTVISNNLGENRCKAIFNGEQTPRIRKNMKVQLVRSNPRMLSEQKAAEINIKKVMHIDLKSRRSIAPNPLKYLKITTRATFFIGSKIELEATGMDCHEDPVKNLDLHWSIEGDKSGYILRDKYFTPLRRGEFKITVRTNSYGLVASTTLHVKKIQKLEISPQYKTIPFNKRLRFSCKGRLFGNEPMPQELLQLSWRVRSSNLEVGKISKNGIFTAGNRPGLCTVIATLKRENSKGDKAPIYADAQVYVVSPIVPFDIFCDGKKLMPGASVQAKLGKPRQFGWEIGDKKLRFLAVDWHVIPKDCATIDAQGYFRPLKKHKGAKIIARIKGASDDYFPDGMGVEKIVRINIAEELIDTLKLEPLTQMKGKKEQKEIFLYRGSPILFQIKAYKNGREIPVGEVKVRILGNLGEKYKIEENILQITPNQPTVSKPYNAAITVIDKKSKTQIVQLIKIVAPPQKISYIDVIPQNVDISDVHPQEYINFQARAYDENNNKIQGEHFKWQSQPSGYVNNGLFIAPRKTGIYKIIAETKGGSGSCSAIVREKTVAKIEIIRPTKLRANEEYPLDYKLYGEDNKPIFGRKVRWSASNAKVDEKGIFVADKPDVTARVYLEVVGEDIRQSATIWIVKPKPILAPLGINVDFKSKYAKVNKVEIISDNKINIIAPGGFLRFQGKIYYEGTKNPEISHSLQWKIVEKCGHKIAQDGKFVAKGKEIGQFHIKAIDPNSGKFAVFAINVRWPLINTLKIKVVTSNLFVGQKMKLSVNVRNIAGNSVDKYDIYWSCPQAPSSAIKGDIFTAPSIGEYTIIAVDKNGSARDAIMLNVRKRETPIKNTISHIKIVAPKTVYFGQRVTFYAMGYSQSGWVSNISVNWNIKPTDRDHTISSRGSFTAGVKSGKVYVTATLTKNPRIIAKTVVMVKNVAVTMKIEPKKTIRLLAGEQTKFTAILKDWRGKKLSRNVVWKTDAPNRINASGLFMAGNKPGKFRIRALHINTGLRDEVTVIVKSSRTPNKEFIAVHYPSVGLSYRIPKKWKKQSQIFQQKNQFIAVHQISQKDNSMLFFMLVPGGKEIQNQLEKSMPKIPGRQIKAVVINNIHGKLIQEVTQDGSWYELFLATNNNRVFVAGYSGKKKENKKFYRLDFKKVLQSLSISTPSPSALKSSSNGYITMQEEKYDASYQVKNEWTRLENEATNGKNIIYILAPNTMLIFDFRESISVEKFLSEMEQLFRQSYKSYYRVSSKPHRINALNGKLLRYKGVDSDSSIYRLDLFYVARDKYIYSVVSVAPEKKFDTYRNEFRRAMNSLKVATASFSRAKSEQVSRKTIRQPEKLKTIAPEVPKSIDFITLVEPKFSVLYKVNAAWKKQEEHAKVNKKTVSFSIVKNKVGIAFSFSQYSPSLEKIIASTEKIIEKKSIFYYGTDSKAYNINDFSGKLVRYIAINAKDHQSYIMELFFAVWQNNSYIIKLWAPEKEFSIYASDLHKAMNSLHIIKKDQDDEPESWETQDDEGKVTYQSMRFFEAGNPPPDREKRSYSEKFSQSDARYIYYEIYLKNSLWQARDNEIKLEAFYYKPDGSLGGKPVLNYTIPVNWQYIYLWHGWGWNNSGNWELGTYRVEIFSDGKKLAEKFFTVVDEPKLEYQADELESWENQSDDLDENLNFIDIKVPEFKASYRVNKNWKKQESASYAETISYYYIDQNNGILFYFRSIPVGTHVSLDRIISEMEANILKTSGSRRIRLKYHSIGSLSGKIATYTEKLKKTVLFYAKKDSTIYITGYTVQRNSGEQYVADFLKSMESLKYTGSSNEGKRY